MMTIEEQAACYTARYKKRPPAATPGPAAAQRNNYNGGQPKESIPEFIGYLFSFIRHNTEMVRLFDRALKERYGDGEAKAS